MKDKKDILKITTTFKSAYHDYTLESEHVMEDRHKDFPVFSDEHVRLLLDAIHWNEDNMVEALGKRKILIDSDGVRRGPVFGYLKRNPDGTITRTVVHPALTPDGFHHKDYQESVYTMSKEESEEYLIDNPPKKSYEYNVEMKVLGEAKKKEQ